jgi:hypothetical protein
MPKCLVAAQWLVISMLKVSSRLMGEAVAVKANRELMNQAAVCMFASGWVTSVGLVGWLVG